MCIGFAVLAFTSCEPKEEETTSSNEPIKATYSYLGEYVPINYFEPEPNEELSWEVRGNDLVIKRKNTKFELDASNNKLYIETFGDTICVLEKWYSWVECNTDHFRDVEITVMNIPKGKWVVNNVLEFSNYILASNPLEGTVNPRTIVPSHNVFTIEVE